MGDYTKFEHSGGGSPRLLILLIVAVHYTCIDCIHVNHIVHYKVIRTYNNILLGQLQPKIGNIANILDTYIIVSQARL